jgi:acyl-CoA reductase-like NAD-dependent aldehyde dehydrogenase
MEAQNVLTRTQRAGLLKLGDALIPGDGDLPSFSAAGCADEIHRMLPYMTESDRQGAMIVLTVFRFLPAFLIRAIVALTDYNRYFPGPLGGALRLIQIGVKGMVMTLYYSDIGSGTPLFPRIGWDAEVVQHEGESPRRVAPPPAAPPLIPPDASAAEHAMRAARLAAASVRALPLSERLEHIAKLKQTILDRREEIIDRIQKDTGKSRSDALVSEIFGVLDNLAWLEKFARKALSDRKVHTPLALMGKKSQLWFEPLGTLLIISPWNYPFYQAIVPIACAFVAGNTVVYKPSEWTPLEGLVEDLLAEAEFAPNWVRIVYGDGRAGADLIDQRPDKIFFTGSTRTGRKIMAQAAQNLIPVELELGGKDAMIVFDDVNVERAAAGAAWGGLTTTGQSCTSVERIYVQERIFDAFRDELAKQVQRMKQEIDRDGDADVGAMTTDFQVKIVARQVNDAKVSGARFLTGGDWNGVSRLIPPMVVENVNEEMALLREETFGPVLPLLPFRTEDEVVRRANDSEYGLTASVWSNDLRRARRVARALAVGGVSINNVMATEANPALPFGGVKQSGFGRYKGEHGLHSFCNVKSVLIDKDGAKIEANWYPYTGEKYRLFTDMMVPLFRGGWLNFIRFARAGMKLEKYSNKARREG